MTQNDAFQLFFRYQITWFWEKDDFISKPHAAETPPFCSGGVEGASAVVSQSWPATITFGNLIGQNWTELNSPAYKTVCARPNLVTELNWFLNRVMTRGWIPTEYDALLGGAASLSGGIRTATIDYSQHNAHLFKFIRTSWILLQFLSMTLNLTRLHH